MSRPPAGCAVPRRRAIASASRARGRSRPPRRCAAPRRRAIASASRARGRSRPPGRCAVPRRCAIANTGKAHKQTALRRCAIASASRARGRSRPPKRRAVKARLSPTERCTWTNRPPPRRGCRPPVHSLLRTDLSGSRTGHGAGGAKQRRPLCAFLHLFDFEFHFAEAKPPNCRRIFRFLRNETPKIAKNNIPPIAKTAGREYNRFRNL